MKVCAWPSRGRLGCLTAFLTDDGVDGAERCMAEPAGLCQGPEVVLQLVEQLICERTATFSAWNLAPHTPGLQHHHHNVLSMPG